MRRIITFIVWGLSILRGATLPAQNRIDGDGFAEREQFAQHSSPLLEGLTGAAFNDTAKAEKFLPPLIAAEPRSAAAAQAREALGFLYFRRGAYRQALRWIDSALADGPDDANLRGMKVLLGQWATHPDQQSTTVPSSAAAHLREGNIFVAVRANGLAGEYILDSGANTSLISESEARRLGMKVEAVNGSLAASGAIGRTFQYRLATLDRLEIGGATLRNVGFMVVGDNQQPFVDLPEKQRAVLGIPVLLGLRTMRLRPGSEQLDIGFASQPLRYDQANLCFEGALPLLLASFQGKAIRLIFDTGSARTDFWPRFGTDYPDYIAIHGHKGSRHVRGFDGSKQFDSIMLDEVSLEIAGRTLLLRSAHVIPEPKDSPLDGRLGMDTVGLAKSIVIDWSAMRVMLE
jgi:tetratricopeptide (TPR) repeat protein